MQDSMFVGLDVHKATISIAVANGDRGGEVRAWGKIPNRPDHVAKLVEKLVTKARRLFFCYGRAHADMAFIGRSPGSGMPVTWSPHPWCR